MRCHGISVTPRGIRERRMHTVVLGRRTLLLALSRCLWLGGFRIKAHAEKTRNTPEKTEAKEIKRKEGEVATVKWFRETIMLRSGDDDARLCGKGPSKRAKQHTPTGILFRVCVAGCISSHDHVRGLEYSALSLAKTLYLLEQCYYILIQ